jgi:AP-3 complex subunit sigma
MCLGGMVLETSMNEIVARIDEQSKMEKQETGISGAPNKAMNALKEMNLPQKIKDMKLPDLNLNLRF